MRVVSGIAVSFDGKTSRYLPLPPLLPSRPAGWYQPSVVASADSNSPATRGGSNFSGLGDRQGIGAGGVPDCWEALPERVLESVALFVSLSCAVRGGGGAD